jgi:hypothetical protein
MIFEILEVAFEVALMTLGFIFTVFGLIVIFIGFIGFISTRHSNFKLMCAGSMLIGAFLVWFGTSAPMYLLITFNHPPVIDSIEAQKISIINLYIKCDTDSGVCDQLMLQVNENQSIICVSKPNHDKECEIRQTFEVDK